MVLRMFWRNVVLFFLMILLMPKSAIAQAPSPQAKEGNLPFMEGLALSYGGHYRRADRAFAAYLREPGHSRDLLALLRVIYDRWLAARGDAAKRGHGHGRISAESYAELLRMSNRAISEYEKYGCATTDLTGISGHTLDCPYLGAALYGFRAVLVGENRSYFRLGVAEDKHNFFLLAAESQSLQAKFLLGLAEYEASKIWSPYRWMLRRVGVPDNRKDGAALILDSLHGNTSPFVDDIWLYIFNDECGCGGGRKYGTFAKAYPLNEVVRYLYARYPENHSVARWAKKLNLN